MRNTRLTWEAPIQKAGLYAQGSDPDLDKAISIWPELDGFLAQAEDQDCAHSFQQLELLLRRGGIQTRKPA
jgi:flagellum-specific ATP synthase